MCSPRNTQMPNSRILIIMLVESNDQFEYEIFPHRINGILCAMCFRVVVFFLVSVSSVKCAFHIHFSLTRMHNVTDYSHKGNMKAHFREHRLYSMTYEKYSMFDYKSIGRKLHISSIYSAMSLYVIA